VSAFIFGFREVFFFVCKRHQPLEVYSHYIFRQASFQKYTFFRLEVYERAKISRIEAYGYFEKGCGEKVQATIPKGISREAMDVYLRVLKESRFDSCSVTNSVLIISHITFRDCRVHFFFPTTFLEVAV